MMAAGEPTEDPRSGGVPAPGRDAAFDPSLLHRVAPVFKLLRLYSRLEVTGLDRIGPGAGILAANHTGWIGLDYAYTSLSVYDALKRIPRGMAHAAWFRRAQSREMARRLGLFEAGREALRGHLEQGELVILFPEGEKGAFKGEMERYVLQPFARGWVREAVQNGVPVYPVAIIGGEEANPSSGRIDSYEELLNLSIPMPQNFFPRPVKWRISFLEPVLLRPQDPDRDPEVDVQHVTDRVRGLIQTELQRLLSLRGHPYL